MQIVVDQRALRDHDAELVDRRLIRQRRILELQSAVAVDVPNARFRKPGGPITRPIERAQKYMLREVARAIQPRPPLDQTG